MKWQSYRKLPGLGLFYCLFSGWVCAASLHLVPVWEKNVYSVDIRAALLGAVSKNGVICFAMKKGQKAVLVNSDGELVTHLRGDAVNASTLVSISAIGYDPVKDAFWIWSQLVRRISSWDTKGQYLGTTTLALGITRPMIHDSRKIYLRRPDQGSQKSLFSFFPDQDEEILIWQPSNNLPRFGRSETVVSFAIGHHRLAVRDQRNLVIIHLDEWQDDLKLPLPVTWFRQSQTTSGRVAIQTGPSEQQTFMPLLADSQDRFWVLRPSLRGLGYHFALFDGVNGSLSYQGTLEGLPLAVDGNHLYFVDVASATAIWLRKVRFEISD